MPGFISRRRLEHAERAESPAADLPVPKIEISDLSLSYGGQAGTAECSVLSGLSLSIMPGEFHVILGASGCGKSTLLSLIAGFLRPTEGSIKIDGRPVAGPGSQCGMVFQNADEAVFPWLTVEGNIAYGLRAQHIPSSQLSSLVSHYIGLASLSGHERKYPSELSGGMRQRLQIARSLAVDPDVLLMDEPFGALDPTTRRILQDELLAIWHRTGKTIVFVTHDIGEAAYLGERISILSAAPGSHVFRQAAIPAEHRRDIASEPLAQVVQELDGWVRDAASIHKGPEQAEAI